MKVYDSYGNPKTDLSEAFGVFHSVVRGATADQFILGGMPHISTALTTGTPTVDTLYAWPIMLPRGGTVDTLRSNVTTGAGAGGVARHGIYNNTGVRTLFPSSLLYEGTEFTTTGTGNKSDSPNVELDPGVLYWLVILYGVAAPVVRCHAAGTPYPILGVDTNLGTAQGVGWTHAQAYGALPDPFPSSAEAVLSAVPFPAIGVRLT